MTLGALAYVLMGLGAAVIALRPVVLLIRDYLRLGVASSRQPPSDLPQWFVIAAIGLPLLVALYAIAFGSDESTKKWAFGYVGLVVGHILPGGKR